MPDLFLIFNHQITPLLEEDAWTSLGVSQIMDLPEHLKTFWRQIPPELSEIDGHLKQVKEWLSEYAEESDYVLIQGDFAACFIMVKFAFEKGLVPIYSTTEREAVEEYGENGTIKMTHQFKHRVFRRYGI